MDDDGFYDALRVGDTDIRLIACGTKGSTSTRENSSLVQQSPNHIPFERNAFSRVMDAYKVPSSFFYSLFTGIATVSLERVQSHEETQCLLFRTPLSTRENWTLAVSWDPQSHAIAGIIHGAEEKDLDGLASSLTHLNEQLFHPLLMPVCLCEMLGDSDRQAIRTHATELYQVEIRTNFHGFYPTASQESSRLAKTPEQDFEEITRTLNFIISRLAFHEMRIGANTTLMNRLRQMNNPPLLNLPEDEAWASRVKSSCQLIEGTLASLKTDSEALLLELACSQKIAQSQLEIVYNLVAQRDNKDNLKLAKISTEIASVTKDDSFAMRTIAVMSILFLPGTFVSSFFSMSMFDWQAPEGSSVLSSLFWIYWAVTIPLTFVVFLVWRFWLHQHNDHDKAPSRHQGIGKPTELSVLFRRGLHRSANKTSEHEEALAESSEPPTLPTTLVQGPRR
ncbi:MAG: hypothetical protein Q9208_001508 [Pyrenodesmia sp. 3 TL-2023]